MQYVATIPQVAVDGLLYRERERGLHDKVKGQWVRESTQSRRTTVLQLVAHSYDRIGVDSGPV